jgi:hypothetical protein
MRRVLLSLSLVASVCAVPGAAANTSHAGWPQIDGDLIMHKLDQSGPITAVQTNRHNELLDQLRGCRHISYKTLGS